MYVYIYKNTKIPFLLIVFVSQIITCYKNSTEQNRNNERRGPDIVQVGSIDRISVMFCSVIITFTTFITFLVNFYIIDHHHHCHHYVLTIMVIFINVMIITVERNEHVTAYNKYVHFCDRNKMFVNLLNNYQ